MKNLFVSKPTTGKRLHFELPDGTIGITAVYSDEWVLKDIRKEAEKAGHKFLREEIVTDPKNF